ncbi:hypothetical protein [Lamprobacter modestohalophilus]|uniref:hypothetical protein n=1 Tax=Lamprobacter modestohalophilus TaxID=1064514 RepID=UPI0019088633|nr:hypothetical protein [Lamprobacter modestohalophilus]
MRAKGQANAKLLNNAKLPTNVKLLNDIKLPANAKPLDHANLWVIAGTKPESAR